MWVVPLLKFRYGLDAVLEAVESSLFRIGTILTIQAG
jgi:hypothetical protein